MPAILSFPIRKGNGAAVAWDHIIRIHDADVTGWMGRPITLYREANPQVVPRLPPFAPPLSALSVMCNPILGA